ncbi:hypothetical protein [Microscilla marina]|uniref:Uncharacterized protein n=1 Tax=Microscilla marina ATCC 23134 TaxID=313606 RepID=A1ZWE8_MICM2|nr:hypothetical protein [Microscilla marina]EAY25288.1 hypothetical protein M23134_02758 [Microscilla marina ATCC 23134]
MTNHTFGINSSEDKFRAVLEEYNEYLQDAANTRKALSLATNTWHILDWVFKEFPGVHGFTDPDHRKAFGQFRESLYPNCEALKLLHDIANGSKHMTLDTGREKSEISTTEEHKGTSDNTFDYTFDISRLEINMNDGSTLYFEDEIKKAITFFKGYFKGELGVTI